MIVNERGDGRTGGQVRRHEALEAYLRASSSL